MIGDREQLLRAFPEGHLPRTGVRTVGGWTCIHTLASGTASWLRHLKTNRRICVGLPRPLGDRGELAAGDLLPAVATDEEATWAVLQRELARLSPDLQPLPDAEWWVNGWHPCLLPVVPRAVADRDGHWVNGWTLDVGSGLLGINVRHQGFAIEHGLSRAAALVEAFIQVREGTVYREPGIGTLGSST